VDFDAASSESKRGFAAFLAEASGFPFNYVPSLRGSASCGIVARQSLTELTAEGRKATLLLRVTLNTLKHRNVTEVHWMLERLICLMTSLALAIGEGAQIHGVLVRPKLH
jgi:hypothetical protein